MAYSPHSVHCRDPVHSSTFRRDSTTTSIYTWPPPITVHHRWHTGRCVSEQSHEEPYNWPPATWGGYFKSMEEQKCHALSLRQAQVFTAIIKDRNWSKGKSFDKFKAVSYNTGMRTQSPWFFYYFTLGVQAFSSPRSE